MVVETGELRPRREQSKTLQLPFRARFTTIHAGTSSLIATGSSPTLLLLLPSVPACLPGCQCCCRHCRRRHAVCRARALPVDHRASRLQESRPRRPRSSRTKSSHCSRAHVTERIAAVTGVSAVVLMRVLLGFSLHDIGASHWSAPRGNRRSVSDRGDGCHVAAAPRAAS